MRLHSGHALCRVSCGGLPLCAELLGWGNKDSFKSAEEAKSSTHPRYFVGRAWKGLVRQCL